MNAHLQGIEVFVAVVECGSFTAAADRLGLSKSAVSKQVTALEDRLGARLMNRTTRRLSLTEEGRAYHERCAAVLAELRAAELAVSRLSDTPRGTLRISAPMSFSIQHLAPALADFRARHPELHIDVTLNDRLVDVVDEGYDVAIRIAQLPDSSLIARRLATCRRITAASPAYLAEHGRPAHPRDLARHHVLVYSYLQNPRELTYAEDGRPLVVNVNPAVTANNGDFLACMAASGHGILLSPSFILGEAIRAGHLVPILDSYEADPIAIYAIYPHNRHLSVKVRLFIDFLASRYRDPPPWDEGI